MPPSASARDIVDLCRSLGFAAAGICDAAPTVRRKEILNWLEAGKHGSMAYLANHLDVRLDPGRFLAGARSIIMVADLYESRQRRLEGEAAEGPADQGNAAARGRIARYARGRDYHKVMKNRLFQLADALRAQHPDAEFRAFVDTAPVLEREYAARAGLGWQGKHTLLIHPRLGSYMLLGGVMTTLEVPKPVDQPVVEDHCGTCTRCIDACPTRAITPYSVDAQRCISYLTIEHRGEVDSEFDSQIGEWLFGCDICQEVCPHNSPRPGRDGPAPDADYTSEVYPGQRGSLPILDLLAWRSEDRARVLEGSAMKRATLEMMKRNALIVAGNVLTKRSDPALRARIGAIAGDPEESEMVRQTAERILMRLDGV